MKSFWALSLLVLSSVGSAHAAGGPRSGLKLLNFRLEQNTMLQGSSTSFTGQVGISPTYWFTDSVGAVLAVGAALPRSVSGTFVSLEYQALFTIQVSDGFNLEVGGGAQTWLTTTSSTFLMASLNAGYCFSEKLLGLIDRLFVGYSAVLIGSPSLAHEARAGIRISI